MNNSNNHYRLSGRLGQSLFILPLGGLVLLILASFIYGFLLQYLRFSRIVSVLFTVTYAGGVGLGIAWLSRFAECRSKLFLNVCAAVLSLGAVYCAWVSFEFWYARYSQPVGPREWWGLFSNPESVWENAERLNRVGTFALRSDKPLTGFELWAVWGAEALLITSLAFALGRRGISERVFCETCGRWAVVWPNLSRFKWIEDQHELSLLSEGDVDATRNLVRANPLDNPVLVIDVHQCPICQSAGAWRILVETKLPSESGGSKILKEALSELLVISAEQLKAIETSTQGVVRNRGYGT